MDATGHLVLDFDCPTLAARTYAQQLHLVVADHVVARVAEIRYRGEAFAPAEPPLTMSSSRSTDHD
jgi:hypothetical protein